MSKKKYDTFFRLIISSGYCIDYSKSNPIQSFNELINYFNLNKDEIFELDEIIKQQKEELLDLDKSISGFNIGTNIGKDAGQSIMHCHIHLIPRREGDVEDPQGGVRSVIPKKQHYKRK